MSGAFILNLLSTIPGTVVYHLLLIIALLPAAGILWSDWRRVHSEELRVPLLTLGIVMGVHLLAGLLAPFHVEASSPLSVITAPYLYGVELLSTLLLVWCFGMEQQRRRESWLTFILAGWVLVLALTTLIWYLDAARFPIYYTDSWQVKAWYALSMAGALAGLVLTFQHPRRVGRRTVRVSFFLLMVGYALGLAGLEGPGRLLLLVAYPWFGVLIYQGAAYDLRVYREELQSLSQEALRQSQELLFLIEATRTIGEMLDLRGMLNEVAANVALALRADRVAILVSEAEEKRLRLLAFYDPLHAAAVEEQFLELKDYPMLGLALAQGPVVYRVDEDYAPLMSLFKVLGVRQPGPLLIQPLTRQQRTLGLLIASNDAHHGAFSPDQERLATTIAVQIAGALENSRLYRDLEKKAEELAQLLRSREEELQRQTAIFESMAEGLLASDARGRIILVNAVAEQILGSRRDQLQGSSFVDVLLPAARLSGVDVASLMTLTRERELVLDINERKVRLHIAPVRRADGERLGLVTVLEDITLALQAEEAKREFIASISHELRTPLTAILGYVELLLSGMSGALPAGATQFIQVIRENAIRMNSIAENLIAISEVESRKLGLVYEDVKLKAVLDTVLQRYRRRIEDRHLDLRVELPATMPPFEADVYRLRVILDNLISNAIKFTYPGGKVTITAQVLEDNLGKPEAISFTVADTGVGIRPEDQPHIWERFYRGNNPLSLEAGGLGIGLTITKALVEAHGGRIWVDSTPGQGSAFTFLLPLQQQRTLAQ